MIITCPQCTTDYNIPDGSVGSAGRRVRCSSCGHRWHVDPPSAEPADYDGPEDDREEGESDGAAPGGPSRAAVDDDSFAIPPEDRYEPEAAAKPPRTRLLAALAWLFLLAVIIGVTGLILGRQQVSEVFPGTVPIYRAMGLDVVAEPLLTLVDVRSHETGGAEGPAIVVSGQILNETERHRAVPAIRVALLDADRDELRHSFFDAASDQLAPDEATTFEARFPDAPSEARFFSVLLAPEGP